ncbi:MAG: hypothetical protein Q6352_004780 [Candidatus Freyrarchaeum guaymaensis]|nr:hypothetical protein [Candidatus Sigynarchaeota archaeon]
MRKIFLTEGEDESTIYNLIRQLQEKLNEIGLQLKYIPTEKRWIVTVNDLGSALVPSFLADRSVTATLAVIIALILERGGPIERSEINFLKEKMSEEQLRRNLRILEENGYIGTEGNTITLKSRTIYEIDMDEFKRKISEIK